MLDVDRAVIQNILALIPYGEMSPLFLQEQERVRFVRWCSESLAASQVISQTLKDAPLFEWNREEHTFIVSVEYNEAEDLVHRLVLGFENYRLRRLFSC